MRTDIYGGLVFLSGIVTGITVSFKSWWVKLILFAVALVILALASMARKRGG